MLVPWAAQEEEDRAWLAWLPGFLGRGAQGRERKHASEVPGKGRLLFPVVFQVSSVFPSHPPTLAS